MGISVAEYLAQKEACNVCEANGDHEHCISTLLSRIDNCIFFNTFYYRRDGNSPNDVILLQEMRSILPSEVILEYYINAEPIVKKINSLPNVEAEWLNIHDKFVKEILESLRARDRETVTALIRNMLAQLAKIFKVD